MRTGEVDESYFEYGRSELIQLGHGRCGWDLSALSLWCREDELRKLWLRHAVNEEVTCTVLVPLALLTLKRVFEWLDVLQKFLLVDKRQEHDRLRVADPCSKKKVE